MIHLSNLALVQSDKKSVEGKKEVSKKEIKSKKPKLEGEKKKMKKNSAKKDIKKVTKPIKKTKKN